jgi:5-oxoprolinase (ATP-hydrolysing) subunit A
MLHRLDLNSDMGERDDADGLAVDAALMPLMTSVNIACGGHAGSPDLIRRTALIAHQHGVAIGAHPGLPDRHTFGRTERAMAADQIRALVSEQVLACRRGVERERLKLRHVKPHGALYNMAASNDEAANAVVRAVRDVDGSLMLYALAGSALARVAHAAGLVVIAEGFADRAYDGAGRLLPRREAGAILEHEDVVRTQLRHLLNGRVITVERTVIPLAIQSLCLHNDTPNAVRLARMIRAELDHAGIEVLAPSHADD